MPSDNVTTLQQRIGHSFADTALLQLALTHPSWLQEHPTELESNQRLEFLGDAVLQLALTQLLFTKFPQAREGELSKRRAALTNGSYLAAVAEEIDLGSSLRLSQSEIENGGRNRQSALEDAFEALIGAVFLDSDFPTIRAVISDLYGNLDERLGAVIPTENPKGRLQERAQPTMGNGAVRYEVTYISGEDHQREYEARVFLKDRLIGTGRGTSKKSAEEAAAFEGIQSPFLPSA